MGLEKPSTLASGRGAETDFNLDSIASFHSTIKKKILKGVEKLKLKIHPLPPDLWHYIDYI